MSRHARLAALLAPFFVALGVRLHGLADESLFMDEIRQVYYYGLGFRDIVLSAATQNQPPLDYWIGHVVFFASDSDFAARFPAALFGSFTVLVLTFLLRSFTSVKTSVLVSLLLALLPFHIYYSQEARPYALPVFLLLALFYLLQRLLGQQSIRLSQYLFVTLVATLFTFSRADFPIIFVASLASIFLLGAMLNRPLAIGPSPRILLGLALALLAAVALYLPVLRLLLEVGREYAPGAGADIVTWFQAGFNRFSTTEVWHAWLAQTEPLSFFLTPLVAIGGIAALVAPNIRRRPVPIVATLLLPAVVIIHLFSFHASTTLPLRPPYLIYLLPLGLLLAAVPIDLVLRSLRGSRPTRIVILSMFLAVAWLGAEVADFKNTSKRTDWRGLADHLRQNTGIEHALFVDSLVKPGKWEPDLYGLYHYDGGSAWIGGSLRNLPRRLEELAVSNRIPVLVIFLPRPYLLTSDSRIPLMNSLDLWRPSLQDQLAGTKLKVHSFTGLTVVRPMHSTGRLASDLKSILDTVTSRLGLRAETIDLFAARAVLERLCGSRQYSDTLNELQNIVGASSTGVLERLRPVLEQFAPKANCSPRIEE